MKKKKLLSLALALVMFLGLTVPASAAKDDRSDLPEYEILSMLPKKLAVEATKSNLNDYELKQKADAKRRQEELEKAQETAAAMARVPATVATARARATVWTTARAAVLAGPPASMLFPKPVAFWAPAHCTLCSR